MESLNSNSQERELHQLQQMQHNVKESCMTSFQLLHSFLQVLSYNESKSKRVSERAFKTLFGQDNETFTSNVKKSVAERTCHKRQYDIRMNERQMQSKESKVVSSKALDASLVVNECSGIKSDEHITSSSSGTYITHVVDADIRPVNNQKPSVEVHLTAQHNILANEQQHTDQSEPSYDTYVGKGMKYDEILPIFQAKFDANMRFLFKSREEMEAKDQEVIKSINETPAQKAAKRRKLSEEAQEADDLRKRLEIVQDEDDDVFVEATPLAQKLHNTLKNFDREDLETLWRIVKDRFSTSKPTNFSDEYLLLTLKIMFEEPDGQDAIWRNQKSVHGLALVKR
uniref:Uncharacterized protein n=1 Tax=Tanacetum cinerariifolium TaxID=118510 RepID=A0A6L2LJW2_TANCI|nr:hypothetical protein [Tanacetum cinerariifolium]